MMAARERAGTLWGARNGELLLSGTRVVVTPDNCKNDSRGLCTAGCPELTTVLCTSKCAEMIDTCCVLSRK